MSDLWLNPALLRRARNAAPVQISGQPTSVARDAPGSPGASRYIQDIPRGERRPTAAVCRERRAFTRQLCLRLAALALLGGSAAFSYVAWSDEMRAGRAHSTVRLTDGEMHTPTRQRAGQQPVCLGASSRGGWKSSAGFRAFDANRSDYSTRTSGIWTGSHLPQQMIVRRTGC